MTDELSIMNYICPISGGMHGFDLEVFFEGKKIILSLSKTVKDKIAPLALNLRGVSGIDTEKKKKIIQKFLTENGSSGIGELGLWYGFGEVMPNNTYAHNDQLQFVKSANGETLSGFGFMDQRLTDLPHIKEIHFEQDGSLRRLYLSSITGLSGLEVFGIGIEDVENIAHLEIKCNHAGDVESFYLESNGKPMKNLDALDTRLSSAGNLKNAFFSHGMLSECETHSGSGFNIGALVPEYSGVKHVYEAKGLDDDNNSKRIFIHEGVKKMQVLDPHLSDDDALYIHSISLSPDETLNISVYPQPDSGMSIADYLHWKQWYISNRDLLESDEPESIPKNSVPSEKTIERSLEHQGCTYSWTDATTLEIEDERGISSALKVEGNIVTILKASNNIFTLSSDFSGYHFVSRFRVLVEKNGRADSIISEDILIVEAGAKSNGSLKAKKILLHKNVVVEGDITAEEGISIGEKTIVTGSTMSQQYTIVESDAHVHGNILSENYIVLKGLCSGNVESKNDSVTLLSAKSIGGTLSFNTYLYTSILAVLRRTSLEEKLVDTTKKLERVGFSISATSPSVQYEMVNRK